VSRRSTAPTMSQPPTTAPGSPAGDIPGLGHICSPNAHRYRSWAGAASLVTLSLALAACGSSSTTTKASAASKVKTDWVTFFAGTTPAKTKINLVQNGKAFAPIIDGQASSPMAKSVTATVSGVTINSSTKATVHYSLDLGGKPALTKQTGTAVLQSGTWKVGAGSFCGLLALEQVKGPGCSTK
jgi:hypothetical protein